MMKILADTFFRMNWIMLCKVRLLYLHFIFGIIQNRLDQVNKLMSENNHLKLERKQIVDFVKHAEKMSRKCKPKGQELIAGVFMTAAERSMCEFLINAVSKVFEDDLVEHVMKTFADR